MPEFDLPHDFFSCRWRREPVFLPGGAKAFLDVPPEREEILARIEEGTPHQSDGSTVWFLEGLTTGFHGFERLVERARTHFEWHDIWCDVFVTRGPSTIGSHYDGSDNFTLQFEGTKEWFLSPPESIPAEDRRRRLLGDPGLGRAAVAPAGARRFQVGPGDALYIPSTWVHWGLSDGDSTSVSLVVNVASPVHALQQQITEALRRDPAWSASLPVGPGTAAERRRLLSRLVAQDVPERLRPEIAARVFDREGSRLVPKVLRARPLPTSNAERQPALPDLAPQASFEPGGPVGPELLAAAAAVRAETNLRRLLGRCDARREETADADARRVYEVLRASLPRLARPDLVRLLNDPAVHAWLDATERELPLSAPRPEDPAAHSLGLLLLPAVAPHHRGEPVVCSVPVAEDGSVLLRAVGLRIRHDAPGAVRTALGVWDGTLHWCGPGGPVPVADGTARDGVRIEPLPTAGPGAAVVTTVPDHGGDSPAAPGRPGTERQLLSAVAALAAPGPGRALPGQDRDPYLAWVVVRSAAAPPSAGAPGLAVPPDAEPEELARQLTRIRLHHEFHALAAAAPVLGETAAALPPQDRRGITESLGRAYAAAFLDEPADREPDTGLLSPWGRRLLTPR